MREHDEDVRPAPRRDGRVNGAQAQFQSRYQRRKPVQVDRELWRHCIESCPTVAAGFLFAAWLVPSGVPLWTMTGAVAIVTCVVTWVVRTVTGSAVLAAWLLAWGVALTGWFTAARTAGAWTSDVIAALVFAVVLLTPLGPPAIAHSRMTGTRDAAIEDRARQRRELAKWEMLFARLGVKGVQVTDVHKHASGVQVYGRLGKATDAHGMATYDKIKGLSAEIATHFRLAEDAASFEKGETAADFTLHLRTRRGRRTTVYLPEDFTATTVNKPLELGLHDNGKKFRLLFREIALVIIGIIGAGKSNLLNVLIAQLARCEDTLIFAIDLKGGRMARPWIMPWIENPGGVRRPVIDWLATSRREALLMLDTLIAAGDVRAHQGAGGEKITPRRDRPAIVLIVDESAVATGHERQDDEVRSREIARKLAILIETYRSEAIGVIVAAVRGDVETMGMTAVKAQALARIGLRVSQARDGESIFPDDNEAAKALAKISEEGSGLALVKGRISPPVHFYRITPRLCYRYATVTGPDRPAPDARLEQALGEAYATRWDRMSALVDEWRENAAEWHAEAGIDLTPDMPGQPGDGPGDEGVPAGGKPGGGSAITDDEDQIFREIVAHIEDPDGTVNPARKRMREILFRAGSRGLTVGIMEKMLAEEDLAVHRNTLHGWLRKDEADGRVRRNGRRIGDPYARWIWVRNVRDDQKRDDPWLPGADDDDGEDWPS